MQNFAKYVYHAGQHKIEITDYVNHAVIVSVDGIVRYSDGTPPAADAIALPTKPHKIMKPKKGPASTLNAKTT